MLNITENTKIIEGKGIKQEEEGGGGGD